MSVLMQAGCVLVAFAIPLAMIWVWTDIERFAAGLPGLSTLPIDPSGLSTAQRFAGCLIGLIPVGVLVWGLFRLRRLFALYAAGTIFSDRNAACLRDFALALMVIAALRPLTGALLSAALTLGNPAGQRALAISFGSNEVMLLLLGGLLIVIAWVMREGRRIAEENAGFV